MISSTVARLGRPTSFRLGTSLTRRLLALIRSPLVTRIRLRRREIVARLTVPTSSIWNEAALLGLTEKVRPLRKRLSVSRLARPDTVIPGARSGGVVTGGADGVTALEAADAGPVPRALVAVTVK